MPEDTIRYLRNEIKGQHGKISDLKHKLKFATAVDATREMEISSAVEKYDTELVHLRDAYRKERRELNLEILRLKEQLSSRHEENTALRKVNSKLVSTAEEQEVEVAERDMFVRNAIERRAQMQEVVDHLSALARASRPVSPTSRLSQGRFADRRPGKKAATKADPNDPIAVKEAAYAALEESHAALRAGDRATAGLRAWDPQELCVCTSPPPRPPAPSRLGTGTHINTHAVVAATQVRRALVPPRPGCAPQCGAGPARR